MATLREYFFKELEGFGVHSDLTVQTVDGRERVIVERVNFDTVAGVNFVSYFFPAGTFDFALAAFLLRGPTAALDRANANVEASVGHPVSNPEGIVVGSQRFSGRFFFYVDDHLPLDARPALLALAAESGVRLQIRDTAYADFLASREHPWAFISHDARDKDQVARPLAEQLTKMLCPVWYDEYSLRVGQSLRESIDAGLRDAPKCILILSANFLSNPGWTKAEFNAVMGKHVSAGGGVVLPIWHGVTRDQVFAYSPIVADIYALDAQSGPEELARRLFVQLRPAESDDPADRDAGLDLK